MAVTPDWAQFGHPHQGVDPEEVRWHRKNKKFLIRVIISYTYVIIPALTISVQLKNKLATLLKCVTKYLLLSHIVI